MPRAKPPLSAAEHEAVVESLQAAWQIVRGSDRLTVLLHRLIKRLELYVPLEPPPVSSLRDRRAATLSDDEIELALSQLEAASSIYAERKPGCAKASDAAHRLWCALVAMRGRGQHHPSPARGGIPARAKAGARPALVHDRDAVWDRHFAGMLVAQAPAPGGWRVTAKLLDLFTAATGLPFCSSTTELVAWINSAGGTAAIFRATERGQ